MELYLCGGFNGEEDFLSLFKTKLEKSPNIHLEGWVDTSSVEFHSIVRKCGAIIMPVVSSGVNGSVLIGMSYGLIPILSKDCNVDIGGNGIMFEDISEESIENAIGEYVKHDNKWFSKTSKAIFEFTSKEYSEKNFKENLNKIFDPFFSTKFTGRGLGLAAVYGIIKHHKGTIKVESNSKKGTCIKLLFPVE